MTLEVYICMDLKAFAFSVAHFCFFVTLMCKLHSMPTDFLHLVIVTDIEVKLKMEMNDELKGDVQVK